MDIQEATSIIKCIPAIYRHRGYYDKDGKWFEGEGNLLTEKEITAIETILSELENKDKVIDEILLEFYKKAHIGTKCYLQDSIEKCMKHKNCIGCLREHFTKKAEGN